MEILRLRIEKQGRGGKIVTVVEGFTREKRLLDALASELKRKLGCGGSFAGSRICLQGDIRERLRPLLLAKGFSVKG